MRAWTVLVVLFVSAGYAEAGAIDKPKLRKLPTLPTVEFSVVAHISISSTSGLSLNEEKPDPAVEIARLQKQMKGDASDAERYQRLGKLYHKTGKKKESDEAYNKCVALYRQQVREHPEDKHWLARLGDALTDIDQNEEGEKLLRRAVQEAPQDWWAWMTLARFLDGQAERPVMGDSSFSIRFSHEKVINSLRDRKPTDKQIAEMHRLQKEASQCYDRAIQLAPRKPEPNFHRAASRWMHGAIEIGLRMSKGEKIDIKAALITPQCAADMSQVARLSPDDPKAITTAAFLTIFACLLHEKVDPNSEGDSLLDFLPAKRRDFVRWAMNRLEQLTKGPDKSVAAAAAEGLVYLLMVSKMPEDKQEAFPKRFGPKKN